MQITQLKVLNVDRKLQQRPEIGGGGVPNSFEGAEGLVFLNEIEVDRFFEPEINYEIYDRNGEKDAFNDPLLSLSGHTYVTIIEDRYFLVIGQMLEGIADPTDGSLDFSIQFSNAEEDIGIDLVTDISIPNNEQTQEEESVSSAVTHEKRNHGDQTITYPDQTVTTQGPGTCDPTGGCSNCAGAAKCGGAPGAGNAQSVDEVSVPPQGDEDFTSEDEYLGVVSNEPSFVEETISDDEPSIVERPELITNVEEVVSVEPAVVERPELITNVEEVVSVEPAVVEEIEESTATTEEEYLGETETQTQTVSEPVIPQFVSNEQELRDAINTYDVVFVRSDITLEDYVSIPGNTKILGFSNPTITFKDWAFDIRESNIELRGFTLKPAGETKLGIGIQVTRPSRQSLDAPDNIKIDSITFENNGGAGDKWSAVTVLGYNFVESLVDSDKTVPGLLPDAKPITNLSITNNLFENTQNNALDLWNIDGAVITNNVINSTRGSTTLMGNGIRANSLSNSTITSNTLTDIGRSAIEVTGNGTSKLSVRDNLINVFGTQTNLTNTFTSGVSIVQGANDITVKDNNITGSGIGGGVEVAQNSSNALIENNIITNVNKGVTIAAHVDTFEVKDNVISDSKYGVQLYQVWNGVVNSNTVTQKEGESIVRPAISIEQSNGVAVVNNQISGDYFPENNETAILTYSNYPGPLEANRLQYGGATIVDKLETIKYSLGQPSKFDLIYNSAASSASDLIANTFAGNKLNGQGRPFFNNSSVVVFPENEPATKGEVSKSDKQTPDVLTFPKTDFVTTVVNTTGESKTADEVVVDSQDSSSESTNTSTVVVCNDTKTDTCTFCSVESTCSICASDLCTVCVNTNPGYGCNNDTTCKCSVPTPDECLVAIAIAENALRNCVDTNSVCTPGGGSCACCCTVCLPGQDVCIPSGEVCLPGAGTVCLPGGGEVCLPKGGSVCLPGGGEVCLPGGGTVSTPDGCQCCVSKGCETCLPSDGCVCLPGGGTVCFPGGGTVCITRGGCVCAPGPIFPDSTIGGGSATDDPDSDDDGRPIIFPGGGINVDPIPPFPEEACESCCIPGPFGGCCITGPLDPTDPSRRDVCIDDGSSDSDDDYNGGGIFTPNGCIGDPVTTTGGGGGDGPPFTGPPPTFTPPPTIIFPPPQQPPFVPADCGKPPVPRKGVEEGEDPDTPIPKEPEQPEPETEILLYPAPVLPLQVPFLSDINFDTNSTLKVPPPFSFEEEVTDTAATPTTSESNKKEDLCDDEEDCNKLGF